MTAETIPILNATVLSGESSCGSGITSFHLLEVCNFDYNGAVDSEAPYVHVRHCHNVNGPPTGFLSWLLDFQVLRCVTFFVGEGGWGRY